jgi:hypothetical protein
VPGSGRTVYADRLCQSSAQTAVLGLELTDAFVGGGKPGPHRAVTDSSIKLAMTARPALTAMASKPSLIVVAMSAMATFTLVGTGMGASSSWVW